MNSNYPLTAFQRELDQLNIKLEDSQIRQFIAYYEILVEWNKVMNLTGITEWDEVVTKHFIDSLAIVKATDIHKVNRVIDIGTGAGFPGIPLKIAFPHLEIVLLDSLKKRINFLDEVIKVLGLEKITTIHGRAEDFAKQKKYRETFDLCVSRAVASLNVLSEYCLPFVETDGYFISYKSGKIEKELIASEKAVKILGGTIELKIKFNLADTDAQRTFVIIHKVKNTPKKYPRKAGLPAKEPI